jgi:hypothetical protein
MTSSIDFIPTEDVLLRDPTLAYTVELPVLGLPTRFETNSRYVYEMIAETFDAWQTLGDRVDAGRESPLCVRGPSTAKVEHPCGTSVRTVYG